MFLADLQNRHRKELLKENTRVKEERSKAEDERAKAEEARAKAVEANKQADIARKKAERSSFASRGHLYWSELGKADAIRASGNQGQNFTSLESVQIAADITAELKLKPEILEKKNARLRNVAIAAMAQWDVNPVYPWKTEPGWTTRIAVDFKNQRVAQADKEGNIAIRKFGNPKIEFQLPSPGEQAWIPMFSPNGRYYVARHHHPVTQSNPFTCLWDVDARKEVFRLDRAVLGTMHAFSADSSMLAICRDGNVVEIYSTESGKIKFSFETTQLPTLLHFARNDTQLILAENESARIDFWELTDSPEIVKSVAIKSVKDVSETVEPIKPKVTALDWNDRLEHLAIATRNDILVWSPGGLEDEPVRLTAHEGRVVELALHPTGKALMSSSWDGTTRLFDLITNKQVIRIEGRDITKSGFNETGSQIGYASQSDEFGIWTLPNNRPYKTLISSTKPASNGSAKFVPGHSELIVRPTQNGVEIWNQIQQSLIGTVPSGNTNHVCFSDSKEHLYTSGEEGIRRWDYSVDVDKTGSGMSVDEDSRQDIWDSSTGFFDLNEPRDLIATKTKSNYITLIDLNTKRTRFIGPHTNVSNSRFTPDGRQLITVTWHGNGTKVWDTATGEQVKDLAPQSSSASIGVSESDNTLFVVTGSTRSFWSMTDWSMISERKRENPDGWPGDSAYSPDGKLLVSIYSRYQPQLINPESGNRITFLAAPAKFAFSNAQWSEDGRFVLMTDKERIHVWDIAQIRIRLREMGLDW